MYNLYKQIQYHERVGRYKAHLYQLQRAESILINLKMQRHRSSSSSPYRLSRRTHQLTFSNRTFNYQYNSPSKSKKFRYLKQIQQKGSPQRKRPFLYLDPQDRQNKLPTFQLKPQQSHPTPLTPLNPTPIKQDPSPSLIIQKSQPARPTPSKGNEQNDYAKLKERFDKLEQQHKRSHQKITNLQEEMAQLQQEKEDLIPRAYKFFEGQVLVGFQDYKERLTHLIQENFGAKIKRTKLLYRLEKDHPRNLHPFVDGHAPFVVIVKNKQEDREYHFACISEGVIHKDVREQKRGWLMSLTNGRTYSVANGKSAVLYDEMYLIFGNQQLRIDGGSSKAFSNFGISNSFYNTTGNDVRDFLGPGLPGTPREADIDSYEIFQVIF